MAASKLRRQIPCLILLYCGLATVWGWRLHSRGEAIAPDPSLQETQNLIATRFVRLPQKRMHPALFQLGMLPEAEVKALATWLQQSSILRFRQITVQQGPVHTPSPVNDALLLSEIARTDAPSTDEMRLLVAAAGDRIDARVQIEALEILARQAMDDNDPSLAVDILLRACDCPAADWEHVVKLAEASRIGHRTAAALRVVKRWLDAESSRLTAAQKIEAKDLHITLLIEGGRHAEASRLALDELRSFGTKTPLPSVLLERALRAASAAEETAELLPWLELHLRTFSEHRATWEQIADGLPTTGDYCRWLYHAAAIADSQNMSGTACDYLLRTAATGDLRVLGRLHVLARQVAREQDLQRLLSALQQRPQNAHHAISLARALAEGGASSAAHDLLVGYLQKQPADREAAFTLATIDHLERGDGAAAVIWESFLKQFPGDVQALQQLASVQVATGRHSHALRTLQSIPVGEMDNATLRQIDALGTHLNDVSAVHHSRQLIVERQTTPSATDLLALASAGRQHHDPASASDFLRLAVAKAPKTQFNTRFMTNEERVGQAEPFATAVEQVRSAIKVEE